MEVFDVIIIGAGTAGLTAGIYAARAKRKTLILDKKRPGGQAATTDEMENYPGFPDGVGGYALAEQMSTQATRFGAEIAYEEVISLKLDTWPFLVKTYGPTYKAKTLVLCTGTSSRKLGVPGEAKFIGHGVSFCATCDGYFYKDKTVVVVGGGDSAVEEGMYLTRFCQKVIVVHRRDELRAGPILQERAFANEKMAWVWDSVVTEVLGDDNLHGVRVRNKAGEERVIDCDGMFVYIGLDPNVSLVKGKLELTEDGYIKTDKRQRTNIPGVFAAGDCQDSSYRQAVTAAGTGCMAAIDAERYLQASE